MWGYLAWFYPSASQKHSTAQSSIVDVDLSSSNHYFHPLAGKLIEASKNQTETLKPFWKHSHFWWYSTIFSLILVALAQPVITGKRLPDPPPERDIIFLVDVSISMQLADYQQQGQAIKRIDVLRNLLDEFTTKMQGEKISVILFAEQAYVLVPLSNDQNLIRRMLQRINTTLAGRFTAVGDALLMALNESLSSTNIKTNSNKFLTDNKIKRHQTIILFTDADASRGKTSASAAAKIIGEHDIPIFTIAIGSSAIKDKNSIEGGLYQPVDLNLLKDIAKQSKGESYQVNDAITIEKALQDILSQRQNQATPKPKYEIHQLYLYPLLLALLLLIFHQVERLLNILHKTGDKWGGVL